MYTVRVLTLVMSHTIAKRQRLKGTMVHTSKYGGSLVRSTCVSIVSLAEKVGFNKYVRFVHPFFSVVTNT